MKSLLSALPGLCAAAVLTANTAAAAQSYDSAELEANKPPEVATAPEPGDPFLEAGRKVYLQRCAPCHGARGAGDGPAANFLDPRPRDFTLGVYAFRTTSTGEYPTDADLFRSISRGVPGTSMPAWGEGNFQLGELQRWQLVYYLKFLGADFYDDDFNPYAPTDEDGSRILEFPPEPATTPERIEAGRVLFLDADRGGCVRCHGAAGRGNGTGEDAYLKNDRGDPIQPTDMTKAWKYKNGATLTDIYRTFTTGLNGTPMPGFVSALPDDDDRWNLAMYVRSLQQAPAPTQPVMVAAKTEGELPMDAEADAWRYTSAVGVPLAGQSIVGPRLHAGSVDYVEVRALYNDSDIAFRFVWHDRVANRTGPTEAPTGPLWTQTTPFVASADMHARAQQVPLPDQLAIQFPAGLRSASATTKPYLLMGNGSKPVNAWMWRADQHPDRATEVSAAGTARGYRPQPEDQQATAALASFDDGRWTLVLRRSLRTDDRRGDTQFDPEAPIPFAIRIWDGSVGEWELQSSMSAWYHVQLEAKTPKRAYLYALLGLLLMLALELLAVRALKASPDEPA